MKVSRSLNCITEYTQSNSGIVHIVNDTARTYFDTLPPDVLEHVAGLNNPKVIFDFNADDMNLIITFHEITLFIPVYKKNSLPLLTAFIDHLQANEECEITLSPMVVIKNTPEKIPILSGVSILEFSNNFEIRMSLLAALKKIVMVI